MRREFLSLHTPAAAYPVSTGDLQLRARIDASDEVAAIEHYIATATQSVEEMAGRCLLTQTWEWKSHGLSGEETVTLPKSPVQSIAAITYQDGDDATQTLTVSDFFLFKDDDRAYVRPKDGVQWPETYDRPDAVTIRFIAGYTSALLVPVGLRQAITLLATHWFEHRSPVSDARAMPIPYGVEHLVNLHRLGWVGS